MLGAIKTIVLKLPYRMGSVNCYLIETGTGYILIDAGCSNKRKELEKVLESTGCQPGDLKLIILTHGDFDHTGNASYLRRRFGTKIAMHHDDSGMVERGNMFWNRKKNNFLIRIIAPIIFKFGKSKRFEADCHIEEGYDLNIHGLKAEVINIPGHSKGSIGILTANADLFCGDLLENTKNPRLNSIIDNSTAANASMEKLNKLNIRTVYPGHGKLFPMELLRKNNE